MNLEPLDQELSRWKELLANAGQNLVELDAMTTYQALRSDRVFRGVTEPQVRAARQSIDRMWNMYGQISDVLGKAQALRDSPPVLWKRDEWMKEISALLHQPTVDDALPDASFPAGNLTASPIPPRFTVGRALAEVLDAFERTKTIIAKLDARYQQITDAVMSANKRIALLGTTPGVDSLGALLTDSQSQAEFDPLGEWQSLFETITARISKIESQTASIRRLQELINAGQIRLNSIPALGSSAQKSHDICIKVFGDAAQVPPSDITELSEWLATLKSKLGQADSAAVSIGLSRWTAALEAKVGPIEACQKANAERLSRVDEIRGRLSAARARVSSKGTMSVELADQFKVVETNLAANPLNLAKTEAALVSLETLIRR